MTEGFGRNLMMPPTQERVATSGPVFTRTRLIGPCHWRRLVIRSWVGGPRAGDPRPRRLKPISPASSAGSNVECSPLDPPR